MRILHETSSFHRKSLGYDCKKLFNLCLIESNVLVFVSGNLIHFFHISTKEIQTRASVGGQGIGFVTVICKEIYQSLEND